MENPVSVTRIARDEPQTDRTLSRRGEARVGVAAASVVGLVSGLSMAAFVALTWAAGFVLHTPIFVASWAAVTGLVAGFAYRQARDRAGRYRIGARMDADAFANLEIDLVLPGSRGGYELALTAGMTGFLDEGNVRQPIEGLTHDRRVLLVPLTEGTSACISVGNATYVVRVLPLCAPAATALPAPLLGLPGLGARRFMVAACQAAPVAALLSLAGINHEAVRLSDADLVSAIPANATPMQVERLLQAQAQTQAESLHACFDPLPLYCQKDGYVGVGLRLAKTGEVLHSWVSRTTYGPECPVTACMERIITNWFFEPVRVKTTLVLPVQVLQTNKPRPAYRPVKLARSP